MDKRYKPISTHEQIHLRQQVIDELLAHPEWTLQQSVGYLRKTLRLTIPELARLARIAPRTLQEIELGSSPGTVKSMNSIFGVLGLRLGVVRDQSDITR